MQELIEKIEQINFETSFENHQLIDKLFKEGLEKEKEQIKDAFNYGWNWNYDAEKYYNETYNQNN